MLDLEKALVWTLGLGLCIGFWIGVIFTIILVTQ